MALTEDDIQRLISLPKAIDSASPVRGYTERRGNRRRRLNLRAAGENVSAEFTVFIRQNLVFEENFSIGLRYRTGITGLGNVTLVRYNGPHGEYSRDPDGHFAQPHVHRITAAGIAAGRVSPKELDRQITDRYSTFDSALFAFLSDVMVEEFLEYFPNLRLLSQPRSSDEPCQS